MQNDNYVYFVITNETSRDNGSKSLEKGGNLPKFKNLQKRTARQIKKGNWYHFALPIEEEAEENLSETWNNIKLSIYSLHELSWKLNLRSITISKTSKINWNIFNCCYWIFNLFSQILPSDGLFQNIFSIFEHLISFNSLLHWEHTSDLNIVKGTHMKVERFGGFFPQ